MACRDWEITVFCREEESTEAVVITVWSMGAGDTLLLLQLLPLLPPLPLPLLLLLLPSLLSLMIPLVPTPGMLPGGAFGVPFGDVANETFSI